MKKERVALLGLLCLALALRLSALGKQSLWYDEGVSWYLTRFSLPDLIRWTAADIQPPLYYLLEWGAVRLWGQSEFALRFLSVGAGVLIVPVMWQLGRRLFPALPHVGLWAAALITFAPLMVYYSQEARMYTLLVLEAGGSSLLFWQLLHQPANRKLAVGYASVMAAALYTHYFAAFLLPAHALFALACPPRGKPARRVIAAAFGGVALLFAPWLPVLSARLGDDPSYWPGALKLNESLRKILISFTAGETVFEQTGWRLTLIYFGFLIVTFGLQFAIQNPVTPIQMKSKIQNPKSKI